MKTGVITFHRTTNYGAIFQTFALQNVIIDMGYECEVVDYRSDIIEKRYDKKNIMFYCNPKNIAKIILQNAYIRDNRRNFESFTERYITTSDVIYTKDNIEEANLKYDFFIVGSDQVWNGDCMGWDNTFLLSFADADKRNSYAASFGVTDIDESCSDWYKKELIQFSHVSTREKSGTHLFKKITGKECATVLDPTLLLRKEWFELSKTVKEQSDTPYILVYVLKETPSIFNFARKLSKMTRKKIIYINDRLFGKAGIDNRYLVSPEEWLNLFCNASYVVTNSFHGTAFALNLNIPFWVELLPPPSKVNSRITDLLSMCKMDNRIISDNSDLDEKIDFGNVNEVLNKECIMSKQFITSIFK